MSTVKLDTRELDAYIREDPKRQEMLLDAMAFSVEAEAKPRTRWKTGAMRNSIHVEKINEKTRYVQDGVEYGIYQELGTSKMSGQPFMVPGVEATAKKVPQLAEKIFSK